MSAAAAHGVGDGMRIDLLVVGDWGFPAAEQKLAAAGMAKYVAAAGRPFAAVLAPGDLFKKKPGEGTADEVFRRAFEEMYDPAALPMPFYAVVGNHDIEYGMVEHMLARSANHPRSRWRMPGRWYRLAFPQDRPLVCVFMIDTNRSDLGTARWKAQMKWLDDELSALPPRTSDGAAQSRPWTVVCMHHPLFSAGSHGDSRPLQAEIGPVLRKHKVDFCVSGHDHILAHIQREGWDTTFIVSGGGGENVRRSFRAERAVFCRAAHGFAHLEFSADQAAVHLAGSDAQVMYSFRRQRAAVPATLPAAAAGAGR